LVGGVGPGGGGDPGFVLAAGSALDTVDADAVATDGWAKGDPTSAADASAAPDAARLGESAESATRSMSAADAV
jgi:hypothetical protein